MADKQLNIAEDIITNHTQLLRTFEPLWKRADENLGLAFGEHWSDKEIKKFESQGRVPVNFPILFQKLLALIGHEKSNREEFKAEPMGMEDELNAELFNVIFRHIEKQDDPKKYEYTKSDVFFDGIGPLFGAAEVYVEENEWGEKEVKIRHLPYNEVMFDTNFSDYEMTHCSRFQNFYFTYLDELKVEYPDLAERLSKVEEDFNDSQYFKQQPIKDYFFEKDTHGNNLVKVIREFRKVNKQVYELHNIRTGEIEEYYSRKEAEDAIGFYITEALKKTIEMVMASRMENPETPEINLEELEAQLREDFIIKPVLKRKVEYTKIAGTVVLEGPTVLDVDEIPITCFFSIFYNGKFKTILDIGRDLQRYFDRLFSQLDYNLGMDSKVVKELDTTKLDGSQTDYQIEEALNNGGIIYTKGSQAIKNTPYSATDPNYFNVMNIIQVMADDFIGGKNFQGGAEGSQQAGVAIEQLVRQATTIALSYIDNLRRYDTILGRKVAKYVKQYYTHEFTVKVTGEALSERMRDTLSKMGVYQASTLADDRGYVVINSKKAPNAKNIGETKYNIEVKKISARADEKDIEFQKLYMMAQSGVVAVPPQAFLDNTELSATTKAMIIEATQQRDEQQAAITEREQQLEGVGAAAKIADSASKMASISLNSTKQNKE